MRAQRNTSPYHQSCTTAMPESPIDGASSPLSPLKTVLVGAAVTLGNIAMGCNTHVLSIGLDGIAHSLEVTDADLQWTFNSFLLAFVSRHVVVDILGITLEVDLTCVPM